MVDNINENYNTTLLNPELSATDRDKILHDLFKGKEGSVDSSFLYKGKGAQLYEKISTDESYPFIDIEISLLKKLNCDENFKKILKSTEHITDVGAGDGQKAVALLEGTGWAGEYYAEDYSRPMLEIAAQKVRENLSGIKLGSLQRLTGPSHLSRECKDNMYLFLGGTICNMTDRDIVNELTNMDNNGFLSGNHILLSYFTAPNTEDEIKELIKIYNSESNRAFHENGMEMLGLSKKDFEFDTIYEKDDPNQTEGPFPGKIKGIIRAKRDCIVKLSNGTEIMVEKGKEFTLHYSRRFTKSGIEKLFKKSGCEIVFTVEKDGDSIVLLKKKPKKFSNLKNIITNTLAGVLIATCLAGSVETGEQRQNREKQQALIEWESKYGGNNENDMYSQVDKELISALRLDEINDKGAKEDIIEFFNKYVEKHKGEGLTTEQLIQGFRKDYGKLLIKKFNITHSPYDFMTQELVSNTKSIKGEISYTPEYVNGNEIFSTRKIDDYGAFETYEYKTFEYESGGKTYIILKAYIKIGDITTPIYLAGEKTDSNNCMYNLELSTNTIKDIKDVSGLDSTILNTTNNLEGNFITNYLNTRDGNKIRIHNDNEEQVIYMNQISKCQTLNLVFLRNGKVGYVIFGETQSGKQIGLGSYSPNGPFTTTTFIEISEEFSELRYLL